MHLILSNPFANNGQKKDRTGELKELHTVAFRLHPSWIAQVLEHTDNAHVYFPAPPPTNHHTIPFKLGTL